MMASVLVPPTSIPNRYMEILFVSVQVSAEEGTYPPLINLSPPWPPCLLLADNHNQAKYR
ncbi:hypothetical protein AAULR_16829, partial [Lacticaseibacillus rhamnosus MTCC 5462]